MGEDLGHLPIGVKHFEDAVVCRAVSAVDYAPQNTGGEQREGNGSEPHRRAEMLETSKGRLLKE